MLIVEWFQELPVWEVAPIVKSELGMIDWRRYSQAAYW
jgi:hypothetical protein